MIGKISRRNLLTAAAALASLLLGRRAGGQSKIALAVYKDPNCGCCEKWVQHMNANGFAAVVTNTTDPNAVKRQHRVPPALWSCHTSIVKGYVIEGHVPAGDVKKVLGQAPKGIVGLSIPGMPSSAPGMDLTPFEPFTVLSFDATGRTAVFAAHTSPGRSQAM